MRVQPHSPAILIIIQEAEWASEPVCIGPENLAPPGFEPRIFQALPSRYSHYAVPARR